MQYHVTESCLLNRVFASFFVGLLMIFDILLLGTSGSSLPSQDRNTLNVPSLDSIQQHPQLGDTCADTADLSGDTTAISTHDAPSNPSVDSSVLKNKSSDEVGSQTTEPSASGSAEPLGLGGGLIPIPKVLISDFKCSTYRYSDVWSSL